MVELDPLIRGFYRDRYREDDRLARSGHGQLEFVRTQELLRRFLPVPPATVLDVGGATGVHAKWLAADGYSVHLVDPVVEHVEKAAAVGGFGASVGDARRLSQATDSVDVTLLLGPLYHLVELDDRVQALREASRVTRPGGLVVAAGISRYAGLLEYGCNGGLTEENLQLFTAAFATGRNHDDPEGFTNAHFHQVDELRGEFEAAGLRDVEVLGVEGPAAPVLHNAAPEDVARLLPSAVRLARLLESDPRVISAGFHFLAFGRV
ncbi:ubiquinone/menaquinone biosynthesis C-methylase UbiE [Kribbella voronezhensis]|uniref:Ubiquinone/menaquinone biosynthesis C-methylase UbiE n=1 Tax=Kribbella voronezhensis TaxID=2512212 RepID=A0A4V3FK41_9ACTN|nr:class I SAM-dependent methyltransferase [Kribbella voronezhensis]TDU88793.1 ubiquinone/menaquinone biosynthesis C-methylase UbiE [Kribbella voronezhensis]